MPKLEFSQIMIDPPWPKKKGGLRKVRAKQTRALDYSTLSVEDIFKLLDERIFPLGSVKHNCFIWTVEQFLADCEREMENRGYKRHARIIWDKQNGMAPAFTIRYQHEYCIWYYRNGLNPVAVNQRGKLGTIIRETSREHSRKPEAIYAYIETLYPDSTKLDVFSRQKRIGWSQFGDQKDYFK